MPTQCIHYITTVMVLCLSLACNPQGERIDGHLHTARVHAARGRAHGHPHLHPEEVPPHDGRGGGAAVERGAPALHAAQSARPIAQQARRKGGELN